jgi:hypothetical protein
MLAAVAALAFERDGKAGVAIDLSGGWTVSVEGDVKLTCTVTVEQTGTNLTAELKCPSVPWEEPLEGSVNPQTRSLALEFNRYKAPNIELHGSVSEDGTAVDGTWEWDGGDHDLAGSFHAIRGIEPPAVPDLSGEWSVETGSGATHSCDATIQQDGTTVDLALQCPGQPAANLTGDIDNRTVALTGGQGERITAVVSPDGLALAGTWLLQSPEQFGPFTARKQSERQFDGDVTGDWRVTFTGGLPGRCDAAAQQARSDVFVAFDCGPAGGWWLRGTIDETTSAFSLTGDAGSLRDFRADVRGVIGEDGGSFTATFVASREPASSWGGVVGTLSGERIDGSPSLPNITGGYNVNLRTTLGERVPCEVIIEQLKEILIADMECAGVGSGELNGWVSPLTGVFGMEGAVGGVALTFEGTVRDEGRFVLEGEWRTDERFVYGCFTTEGDNCGKESFDVPGDANCDFRTNSVDASLVLQVVAGLLPLGDVRCSHNVYEFRHQCCPVVVNALDAALILQLDAGLFGRLAG